MGLICVRKTLSKPRYWRPLPLESHGPFFRSQINWHARPRRSLHCMFCLSQALRMVSSQSSLNQLAGPTYMTRADLKCSQSRIISFATPITQTREWGWGRYIYPQLSRSSQNAINASQAAPPRAYLPKIIYMAKRKNVWMPGPCPRNRMCAARRSSCFCNSIPSVGVENHSAKSNCKA